MSDPIQVPVNPNQEIQSLFSQKGELVTQIEIAQSKLGMINQRLSAILNVNQPKA